MFGGAFIFYIKVERANILLKDASVKVGLFLLNV
jgi:hypothetical protein